MSSDMALPRWFVSEKLDVVRDDFRDLLLDAVAGHVFAHVHLAFNPQEVSLLDVSADVLGQAAVGDHVVPFSALLFGAVGAVDGLRCRQ